MAQELETIFFSYSRDDSAEFALRLAEDLRAAGASVWMDQLDIAPGQRWDRAIEDALSRCKRVLVVLSPAAVESNNVMDEVSAALEDGKVVIPVVHQECKVPFRLRRLQHLDFRNDYDRGLKVLLAAVGVGGSVTPIFNPALASYVSPYSGDSEAEVASSSTGVFDLSKPFYLREESTKHEFRTARTRIVALDFGTTEARVAVLQGGMPVIVEDEDGMRSVPCWVLLSDDREMLVGWRAKRDPVHGSMGGVRLLMGRQFKEVKDAVDTGQFRLSRKGNSLVLVTDERTYTPQDLSAHILERLRRAAENHLGEAVRDAVVTVPEFFDEQRRDALAEAGATAGLNITALVGDATAAAAAYGFDHGSQAARVVAVYEMGGHTFSITIFDPTVNDEALTHCVFSESLGGYQIDQQIADWVVAEFRRKEGTDLSTDILAMTRVREAAEKAKIELSSTRETEINLPYITADISGPKHLAMKLTRARLEKMASDVIATTIEMCKQAIREAGVTTDEIDRVLLAGGQTLMPAVQALVEQTFEQIPEKSINPAEVVALGAAVWAGRMVS